MPFLRRYWHIFALALLPLIPLWPAIFGGQTVGAFDQIRQMAPWNGPPPSQFWDVLQADSALQFYVWRDLVFESWSNGQVPFWNPYQLGGTPLLANSQSAALYPPHILVGVLHVPTPVAVDLLAWFHLFWAGLGLCTLMRSLGASRTGGVIAGASFALSPFMISWTALSSVITTVAWIPWVLWGISAFVRERHRWCFAALALSTAMMVLGGHLQFVAYGGLAAVIMLVWALFQAEDEKRRFNSRAFGALVALVAGIALAAPQLMPVLEYSQYSHRRGVATEEGYAAYSGSAIKAYELIGLAYPKLAGDPSTSIPDIEVAGGLSSYWPQYTKLGANFAEGAIGFGPVVLLLLLSLRKRTWSWRTAAPLLAIGLAGILLALGTVVAKLLYFGVPGWSSTGSPGRAGVLFVMAACGLAAFAVAPNPEEEAAKSTVQRLLPLATFLGATVLFLVWLKSGLNGLESIYPQLSNSLPELIGLATREPLKLSMLMALITVLAGLAWLATNRKHGLILLAPVALSPILLLSGIIRFGNPADLAVEQKPTGRIAVINDNWGLDRAAPAVLPPNTAALNRILSIGGYDSLLHRDTKAMLDDINGQDSAPPANGNIMFVKSSADPQKLAAAGVTEVWALRPVPTFGEPAEVRDGYAVYRLEGPGLVSGPAAPGSLVLNGSTLSFVAEAPGRYIVRQRNIGGWTGNVPVTTDGPWLAVDASQGDQKIELHYVAPKFSTGLILFVVGALASVASVLLGSRRNVCETEEPGFRAHTEASNV